MFCHSHDHVLAANKAQSVEDKAVKPTSTGLRISLVFPFPTFLSAHFCHKESRHIQKETIFGSCTLFGFVLKSQTVWFELIEKSANKIYLLNTFLLGTFIKPHGRVVPYQQREHFALPPVYFRFFFLKDDLFTGNETFLGNNSTLFVSPLFGKQYR